MAGVLKKLEMFIAEIEKFAAKFRGVSRCPYAMDSVIGVVFAARVVENSKQADDFFDCSAPGGYEQSIAFNATPVRWPVDRVTVALKLLDDVLPDAAPL